MTQRDRILAASMGQSAALEGSAPLDLRVAVESLRRTEAELLESRHLVALGEMAGRTAHEVLNPVTAARGRIHRLLDGQALEFDHGLEVLATVLEAWVGAFEQGGTPRFFDEMTQPDPNGRAMLENDLAALAAVAETLATVRGELREGLRFLLAELDRVTVIVDALRNRTPTKPRAAEVDVDDVVTEAARIVEDIASRANVWVQVRLGRAGVVLGDRFELLQILTNLARNGIHAIETAHGHRGGRLELGTQKSTGRVLIRIRDDGSGIPEPHLDKVFESGFTTRANREGSGLGLGIARRLARSMGGELRIEESAVGRGTTFLLELPPAVSAEDQDGC